MARYDNGIVVLALFYKIREIKQKIKERPILNFIAKKADEKLKSMIRKSLDKHFMDS
jgi:hypothetical protein